MPKTEFLQIRFTPEDRQKLARVASRQYLDPSTWARQVILKALADAEANADSMPLQAGEPSPTSYSGKAR